MKKRKLINKNESLYRKNSLRLKDYNYTQYGPYFITICTNKRIGLFENSSICNNILNIIQIVGADLSAQIHCVVISENHIHGIFSLPGKKGISLSKLIVIIKVRITQYLREGWVNPPLRDKNCRGGFIHPSNPPQRIWQRGFYDHIIRDENDFLEKAKYIDNHPLKEEGNIYAEWH